MRNAFIGLAVYAGSALVGLATFVIILFLSGWKLALLVSVLTTVVLMVVGGVLIGRTIKKAWDNPDKVFDGLERKAESFSKRMGM